VKKQLSNKNFKMASNFKMKAKGSFYYLCKLLFSNLKKNSFFQEFVI
jgi:hypothetical protein